MIEKEHYKQKRQELEDLLIDLDVPKTLWHNMTLLNLWLYDNRNDFLGNFGNYVKCVELVREISPIELYLYDYSDILSEVIIDA